MATILKALPRHLDTDALFPGINGNMVTMAFRRACQRAGILDCRFHDLRHTFGSHLAMEGFNLRTIQQLLGHRDLRMTMRYAHLSARHLQQAVNRLDALWTPYRHHVLVSIAITYASVWQAKRPQGDSNPRCRRERAVS